MLNTVPSLSDLKSVSETKLGLRKLFEYFLVSDYSQTFFYPGEVASLKYIMNTHPDDIENKTYDALYTMYTKYFEDVDITTALTSEEDSERLTLHIYVGVKTESGEVVTLEEPVDLKETLNLLRHSEHMEELNGKS
jgi:Tfp pilus assembly ATPase PilU